jgi:hypothetical protein
VSVQRAWCRRKVVAAARPFASEAAITAPARAAAARKATVRNIASISTSLALCPIGGGSE